MASNVRSLKVVELKAELNKIGEPVGGSKEELINRRERKQLVAAARDDRYVWDQQPTVG